MGRVQTPVLVMIVERDDDVRHFHTEPFWELVTTYRETLFKYTGDRFLTREAGENFFLQLGKGPLRIDSIRAQCVLIGLPRANYYYRGIPEEAFNLALIKRIDEIYTERPCNGSRVITQKLRREGYIYF